MRRAHDRSSGMRENQAGQQVAGPGTAAGAAATGGQPRETGERPYPADTTYESQYERGAQQPARESYGRSAGSRGRAPVEAGSSTSHGGLFLLLAGLLTFLVGLAFVVRQHFYHTHGLYAYNWGVRSWGWVLFGLGIATFAVGASHLLGLPMSRPVGIALAVLTAVAGFMIIPFYPLWAIIIVALGIAALWGLAHGHEHEQREQREYERHEYEHQRL
ncbi:MAG: hypothetical protein J2P28_15730 [Actinobacteria bacterium]|nr:hypothetical protein [Actinomycetota bacterium]MBO0836939.1 hypothetical protein [Actinomycetota bacterium]